MSQRPAVARNGQRHERLQAWIAAQEVAVAVYRVSSSWLSGERHVLAEELRSAALAGPMHIARGAAGSRARNFRHHLDIALGSQARLSSLLLLARDLGYLPRETFGEIEALRDHASRLTRGLYHAVGSAGKV